jgi:hypothetical protein
VINNPSKYECEVDAELQEDVPSEILTVLNKSLQNSLK